VSAGTETASSRIICNSTSGALSYDADGTGTSGAAIQFPTLATDLTLTNTDFKIV
jgi:Ca2+-binding RTX toxin-like protein